MEESVSSHDRPFWLSVLEVIGVREEVLATYMIGGDVTFDLLLRVSVIAESPLSLDSLSISLIDLEATPLV